MGISRQNNLNLLQGEEGTALTHWEKRLFENEAMTGTHTQNPIYSRITMALMEDTGWYLPNYAMAEELKWGRGLGCDFYLESCKEWMDKRARQGKSIHPYCNKVPVYGGLDPYSATLWIRIRIRYKDLDPHKKV